MFADLIICIRSFAGLNVVHLLLRLVFASDVVQHAPKLSSHPLPPNTMWNEPPIEESVAAKGQRQLCTGDRVAETIDEFS